MSAIEQYERAKLAAELKFEQKKRQWEYMRYKAMEEYWEEVDAAVSKFREQTKTADPRAVKL